MTNLEWLIKNTDKIREPNIASACACAYVAKHGHECNEELYERCKDCPFNDLETTLKTLNEEHKDFIKLKQ